MTESKLVYNPTMGGIEIPGWQVRAWTEDVARLAIESLMQKRGYWKTLKKWTQFGKTMTVTI
jgi:hypothetical protein